MIKPFQIRDLTACLKDKDTEITKEGNFVVLALKVEKRLTLNDFDEAIDNAKNAESIATEKTFLQSEKERHFPQDLNI